MGVFEGMLLIQVTTVASVTEKNDFRIVESTNSATTSSIRSLRLHTPHHTPFRSLFYTPYQQQVTKRSSRHVRLPPRKHDLAQTATARRIRQRHTHSPNNTLSRSNLHTPYQQQLAKRTSRHVQSTSPKRDLKEAKSVMLRRGAKRRAHKRFPRVLTYLII